MWRFFYTALIYIIQPALLLLMLIRSIKSPRYRRRLAERYGFYHHIRRPQSGGVIIHAASVGEVMAAALLIRRIQQDYPVLPITVTTFTPTGSERVKALWGDKVTHFYLPWDLPWAVRRFLRFVEPKLFIMIETELWPNLIDRCNRRHIPLIIVNARLSARSAQRYGRIKGCMGEILSQIALIAAQDKASAERYLALGAPSEKLTLTGNIKFDLNIDERLQQKIAQFKQDWRNQRPIWIAASTHDGEDEIILAAHRKLLTTIPNLLLLLVPRHPERFEPVADAIKAAKLRFIRRSALQIPAADTQVALCDSMGELLIFYGISDVAFIGGSLIPRGGHNPIEALAFKLPVITGKYVFNFTEIFRRLREEHAVIEIDSNSTALAAEVECLFHSPARRKQLGEAGYRVLDENRGALTRTMNLLTSYLDKQ